MTFGWEGFSFSHPEDWAPVVLTGNRHEGYARVASPGRLMLQCRWRRLRTPADGDGFLTSYLAKLARDAKAASKPFTSERETEDGRTHYRYTGAVTGRGALFQDSQDGRAFVIEVVSTRSDSMVGILRDALRSFQIAQEKDRWAVHGLDVTLPSGLSIQRKEFLAGKTKLDWTAKGAKVFAERWGLADQLLAQYSLREWAMVFCNCKPGIREDGDGFRFERPARWFRRAGHALVTHQPDRNQLVFVGSIANDEKWRPQWDWLN